MIIENFIIFLKTPIGEEIYLAVTGFIGLILMLWVLPKIFSLKNAKFLNALKIAFVFYLISFVIRSFNVIFNLRDTQKPTINVFSMILANIMLFILIKKVYEIKIWKTVLIWILSSVGKLWISGMFLLFMSVFFPTLTQFDSAPTTETGVTDFYISGIGENEAINNEVKDNYFVIHKSEIVTPIAINVINLKSDISFDTKTEGVYMNFECMTPKGILFSSIEDETERYRFKSALQENLNFSVEGYVSLSCYQVCNQIREEFNFRSIFTGEKDNFRESSIIGKINTGKFVGTKVIYIEKRKPIKANIAIVIRGNDSIVMNCNAYIITETPSKTIKKSFTIEYVADK